MFICKLLQMAMTLPLAMHARPYNSTIYRFTMSSTYEKLGGKRTVKYGKDTM